MRPLVLWVRDHLGLTAIGLFGVAAIAVAIIIASGGSSDSSGRGADAGKSSSKQTAAGRASGQSEAGQPQPVAGEGGQSAAAAGATGARSASAANRGPGHRGDRASTGAASAGSSGSTGPHPATTKSSLGKASAEKVAAGHPGAGCPSSYSRAECKRAVEAAAHSGPSIPVTKPSDCGKAMSEAECEALFAAEAAARDNGSSSVTARECIEHPELEACAVVVEQMEEQYEAAHPGG
jgi:hypothetical protein